MTNEKIALNLHTLKPFIQIRPPGGRGRFKSPAAREALPLPVLYVSGACAACTPAHNPVIKIVKLSKNKAEKIQVQASVVKLRIVRAEARSGMFDLQTAPLIVEMNPGSGFDLFRR